MEHSFSVVGYNPSKMGHPLVWGTDQIHNTSVGWDIAWVCHVWGRFMSLHIKEILQQVLIKTVLVLCPSFLICPVAFTNICPWAHVCRFNAVMNFCIMHIFWMCNGLSITANGSRLIIVSKSVQWLNWGKVTWMWHPIG